MYSKIEDIKADSDCREEIARFLGDPIQQKRDYSIWSCPFHAETTVGAFHVWRDGYHCFSCGANGDLFDLWEHFTNRTLRELLAEHGDIDPAEASQRKAEIAERVRLAREAVEAERAKQLAKLHESERHIFYADNLSHSLVGQAQWLRRGIDSDWQRFFDLGYSENFSYTGKFGRATTNSLVIPIKKSGGEVVTIRHRLINALDSSRYRPEIAGLGAHPFICDPSLAKSEDLIIVEGEIKAMVAYLTYDKAGSQVVGIPSKSMMVDTIKKTYGRNAVIIPDPDGAAEIAGVARSVGAHVLLLPDKVDDFIISEGLVKAWMRKAIKQARIA